MKLEENYLTDEQLMQLILDVEENELVSAPPGLLDTILQEVEKAEKAQIKPITSRENRVKEFRRYCIRVITSVAAAVAIIFFTPNLESLEKVDVPSRQELVGENISREEALKENGVIDQIINILNNEIGGLSYETEKKE